jgi:uncharacterized protein (DUF433 family)
MAPLISPVGGKLEIRSHGSTLRAFRLSKRGRVLPWNRQMGSPSFRRTVHLVDALDQGRRLVQADLYRDYPSVQLNEIEAQWAEARDRVAAEEFAAGLAPVEHSHWDWRNKAPSVEAGLHMLVAIELEGEAQGIMAVLREPHRSRLSGEPILYVDYLESAPWNLKSSANLPRFLGVGTILIGEAIRLSLDMSFEGRVGLHSLPQAETFYKNRCQMTEYGQDINYFDLTYFEFSSQQAINWLETIGETR